MRQRMLLFTLVILISFPLLASLSCLRYPRISPYLLWGQTIFIIVFMHIQALDLVRGVMLFFVSTISAVIFSYAHRYMASQASRPVFLSRFCGVIGSVTLLILADNLFIAFIGWQGIAFFIYQLLTHEHQRPEAIAAAKKKCFTTRFGDLCFMSALILAYLTLGTTSYTALPYSSYAAIIAALLACAVMTKSALFPFHRWLPNTLETPTPVSALMHAGVINAGGFLLIQNSVLFHQHPWVLMGLSLIGLITAAWGGLCLLTQFSVKKKLAYSTVSQMGLMTLQYGLGSPAAALFHLLAHGTFKATLFLNSANGLLATRPHTPKFSFKANLKNSLFASLMSFLLFWSAIHFAKLPEKTFLFIALSSLTLAQLLYQNACTAQALINKVFPTFFLILLFGIYVWALRAWIQWIPLQDYLSLSSPIQYLIIGSLWALQALLWLFPLKHLKSSSRLSLFFQWLYFKISEVRHV